MRTRLALTALSLLVLVVATGCGSAKKSASTTTTAAGSARACEQREFGHIKSLKKNGDHYVLQLDPAWFTSGVTANTAAAQDGAVEPGQPVPNDNYVVDETHRTLRYLVPTNALVTVLTKGTGDVASTPISVSELAKIVRNGKSGKHTLFETLDSGVWIRFHIDTICTLDQQYRP